jgi:hypothetical protein
MSIATPACSYTPVVGVSSFFLLELQQFYTESYAGYVIPCRVLTVLPITSYFLSVRGLEFPLFDGGTGTLLHSQWGALGLCALCRVGLLAPAE